MKILFIEEGKPNKSGGFGGSFFSMLETISLLKNNPNYQFAIITYYEVPIIYDLIDLKRIEYRYLISFKDFTESISGVSKNKNKTSKIPFFIRTDFAMYRELGRVKNYLKLFTELKPDLVWGNDMTSGNFSAFMSSKLKGLKYLQHQRAELTSISFNYFLALLFTNHFVAISDYVKSSMISNSLTEFLFGNKISVIYNFNANFKKIKKFELKEYETVRFLFMGRLIPKKNIEEFLNIIHVFNKLKPHVIFTIEIFGDWGSIDYENKIKTLAKNLNLSTKLNIHPFTKKEDIFKTNCMNFLFHTTTKKTPEPFGRVLLDAIYYGAISVTNGYGGAGEVIKDTSNGMVYDSEKIELTIENIYKLIQNPNLYNLALNTNYKYTSAIFSGKKQSNLYYKLLKHLE